MVLFFSAACCSASIEPVTNLQLDLFGGKVFSVPGSVFDKEFFIWQDYYSDPSKVIGQIHLQNNPIYLYEIRGGIVNFTPSQLVSDQSYSDPTNFMNPQRAVGYFGRGGTLTVSGSIWDVGGPVAQEIFSYGSILEAVIDLDFVCAEQQYLANSLIAQMQMTVTGGELATGQQTGFIMLYPSIIADITLYTAKQGTPPGTNLVNFTQEINYSSVTSYVQIYPVPEPATLLLFGLGSLFMLKKKQR